MFYPYMGVLLASIVLQVGLWVRLRRANRAGVLLRPFEWKLSAVLDLLAGVRDRVVIAITFLAMLELMKRREIVVEQDAPWGPIVARRMTAAERTAAGLEPEVVDEEAPLDESLESFA